MSGYPKSLEDPWKILEQSRHKIEALIRERDALRAENERLREAVRFAKEAIRNGYEVAVALRQGQRNIAQWPDTAKETLANAEDIFPKVRNDHQEFECLYATLERKPE